MSNDLDSKWIGLRLDEMCEMVVGFGYDEDDVKKYMIKSIPFMSGGVAQFLELYANLWGSCRGMKKEII